MSASAHSAGSGRAHDRRIRNLRGSKPSVDPYAAHGFLLEEERRPARRDQAQPDSPIASTIEGKIEHALTVFLAGAECPFTCSFCDLWRWTIDGATPVGALPKQLSDVLRSLDANAPRPDRLKLYNASNFFDRRAVPVERR